MQIGKFIEKIRKGESPIYGMLKSTAKRVLNFEAPVIPGVHSAMYWAYRSRVTTTREIARALYYQPMFRSHCSHCGSNLKIVNSGQGLPWLIGNVDIRIGDNVVLYDKMAIIGLTVGTNPVFCVGDNSELSQPTSVFIGKEARIGANCLIGCTLISDNPGHRLDYKDRVAMPLDPDSIGRVSIGDYVWAALESMIVGNVTIGAGAVLAARAVVTRDVPPFCMVAGAPARIVKKLDFPEEMIEVLGNDEFRKHQEAQVRK